MRSKECRSKDARNKTTEYTDWDNIFDRKGKLTFGMLLSFMSHSCPTPWHMSKFIRAKEKVLKCCGFEAEERMNEWKGSETVDLFCLEGRRRKRRRRGMKGEEGWKEEEDEITCMERYTYRLPVNYYSSNLFFAEQLLWVRRSRAVCDECVRNSVVWLTHSFNYLRLAVIYNQWQ